MNESKKVVYRHPKGRFEVVEVSGRNMMGETYRYREAHLTPARDSRGFVPRTRPVYTPAPKTAEPPQAPKTDRRGGLRYRLSDEEKRTMCMLWNQGMSMVEIAKQTGRNKTTVRNYLTLEAQLRTPSKMRGWTEQERAEARRLFRLGYTQSEIAQMLGRSVAAVEHVTRKTG